METFVAAGTPDVSAGTPVVPQVVPQVVPPVVVGSLVGTPVARSVVESFANMFVTPGARGPSMFLARMTNCNWDDNETHDVGGDVLGGPQWNEPGIGHDYWLEEDLDDDLEEDEQFEPVYPTKKPRTN